MEREFVPYKESLELKELGFDDDCICVYNSYGHLKGVIVSSVDGDYIKKDKWDDRLPAPLFQQAFRWFREKCGLDYSVAKSRSSLGFEWYVYDEYQDNWDSLTNEYSYEAAELACLRKMIKIVKKEKQA